MSDKPETSPDLKSSDHPLVGVVMGSKSDWDTMKTCVLRLHQLQIPYEARVVSAHRTPDLLYQYAETAAARNLRIIIAAAGGAAHLPGMIASKTLVPVLGVPIQSRALNGLDSLLSIVQMPAGIPVGTLAIGVAGAENAALLAAQMLAVSMQAANDDSLMKRLQAHREGLARAARESVLC